MPDTPSITIVKRFLYRGQREEFSNTYHFSGTTPGSDAAWKTLADAIIEAEKPIMGEDVYFTRAYGYEAGNEFSVAQIDYAVPPLTEARATGAWAGSKTTPGDTAYWVRWRTPARNSRGKWIYLRKYFHGARADSTSMDKVDVGQRAAAATYAAKMIDGSLPGNFKVCGPQGAVANAPLVAEYLTTRTLKRRGKRPSS